MAWPVGRTGLSTLVCYAQIKLIASLFIRHAHQRQGLGGKAMDLLERVAVDKYKAEWVTVDTCPYHPTQEGIYIIEDKTRPNPNIAWYRSRGYEEFKVGGTSI